MLAVDVAKVEHALPADTPFSGELVVAADLAATNHVAAVTRAETVVGNDRRTANLGDLGLVGMRPTAADVAADITAGPAVDHRRRRLVRRRLDGQIGGRSGS